MFLSFFEVTPEEYLLYAQEDAFSEEIRNRLKQDGITIRPYEEIYRAAEEIPAGSRVLIDASSINDALWTSLCAAKCVYRRNPTTAMKAVKNPVEMEHMRKAHVKDGAAVCRFIFWLKKRMREYDPAHPVTELDVVEKLLEFRREQEHFLDESFETIAAYGPDGAIIHYSPTAASNRALAP